MNQWMQLLATVQQGISSAMQTLGQELAQEVSSVQQQWDNLLGINPTPPNPSFNTAVPQPSSEGDTVPGHASGSGSGSGSVTTALNTSNQPLQPVTSQSGSGSGSGRSGTANESGVQQAAIKVQPMTASGSGSGSNPAPVTITGRVWLDSNGDGYDNNNELGFPGTDAQPTEVDLYSGANVLLGQTRPDGDGNFTFTYTPPPGNGGAEYQVVVAIQQYYEATIPDRDSLIDSSGLYPAVVLFPGDSVNVGLAGLRSMSVNTNDDDADKPIENMTTLRDAIETGNNGPPVPAVTFRSGVSGTISLQAALPSIEKSYDVDGPGAYVLTVDGGNHWAIFNVSSGVVCTISNLSINNGVAYNGGGVENFGNLTLDDDVLTGNQAGWGGAAFNGVSSKLIIQYCSIYNNYAQDLDGGGVANKGKLSVYDSQIDSNGAAKNGGGLANEKGGTMYVGEESSIFNNTANEGGGGIFDSGTSGTVTSATIYDNNAIFGGGIYSGNGSLTLSIDDSISTNTASEGGGLYVLGGHVNMSGGAISSNKATNKIPSEDGVPGGGGAYVGAGSLTLTDVLVSSNRASGDGGGVFLAYGYGEVSISGGTFEFNPAQNNGGGIYTSGDALTLKGGAYFGPDNSADQGGGMYLADGSNTTFGGVTVSGNTASNGGVGVYQQTGATLAPDPVLTDKDDPGGVPFQGP